MSDPVRVTRPSGGRGAPSRRVGFTDREAEFVAPVWPGKPDSAAQRQKNICQGFKTWWHDHAIEAAERGAALTKRMLAFARRQELRIEGNPDPNHIITSFAERSNLSVRMHTRRFTRLTNGFSKKVENHAHSVALFAMYYNFVRIHKTLRTTPAMAAGVTKRLWEIGDIVDVLEAWENSAH